jgi:hypothetical protein
VGGLAPLHELESLVSLSDDPILRLSAVGA